MQKELHSSCEEIFAERYRESESIRPGIIVNGFSAEDAWHCEMHKKAQTLPVYNKTDLLHISTDMNTCSSGIWTTCNIF